MEVETRRDLYNLMELKMKKSYEKLKEEKKLEYEENLLKTYVIETSLESVHSMPKVGNFEIDIEKTKDKTLYIMKVYEGKRPHSVFYLDASDERFWILHTLSKSEKTDRFMNKIIFSISNNLDFLWFDSRFLEDISKNEIFRGFSLKFEEKIRETGDIHVKTLSMKLWGDAASRILETLRKDDILRYSTALSGIGIKRIFNGGEDFVIEDVTFNGKFTARGTTVDGHLYMIRKFLKKYKEKLSSIEDRSIEYESSDFGYRIKGCPLIIKFSKSVEDIERLLDSLLSSTRPFRLWGLKKEINKGFYKILGVDLHTGDKLTMEASPEWLRIYLPRNSCGNTVLRLLTNIQQHFDSGAELVIEDETI
ncbi:MAG: hypothetical protein DRN18_02765 [Thermoplasmata archaeon]|nr:MAG: hypothetical protein DRN18_02765 [Thermoplasmata archaeon]